MEKIMELSAAGLELIKASEGFRDQVYRDSAGFATIGYGHRLAARESFGDGIDREHAEQLLNEDVAWAERVVGQLVRVTLTQGQFDALVDFCFNLGAGRLAGSTLLMDLNAGRYTCAGQQLLLWDHAGGVVNSGLKGRREAEFRMWSAAAAA
jgi:lysozyme